MALEVKTEVTELSPIERELSIRVSGQSVAKELDRAYKRLSNRVKIKGFRKGKIPRYVLEQYYKDDTEAQVLEQILGDSYRQAVKELDRKPVARPDFKAANEIIPGVDYAYRATVEVEPVVELKSYDGLALRKPTLEVGDNLVDDEITKMRERKVQVVPVEDRDEVAEGDLAEINFSGSIDGEAIKGLGGVAYVVEVGAGRFFEEAEKALIGKKIEASFEVDVVVPDDHRVEEARGKTATLSISIQELKQRLLPDLDDDFAKEISDFDTLDKLKESIKEMIEAQAIVQSRNAMHEATVDALIEANPFDVPNAPVDDMSTRMAAQQLGQLPKEIQQRLWQAQGDKLREAARPAALRAARRHYLLEKLIEVEAVEISDESVDDRLREEAIRNRTSLKQLKKMYLQKTRPGEPTGYELLRNELAGERALDIVIEKGKIEEISVEGLGEMLAAARGEEAENADGEEAEAEAEE